MMHQSKLALSTLRTLFLVVIIALNFKTSNAQVGYTYDKAGNRTACYTLKLASAAGSPEEDVEHSIGQREIRLHPNPTKGELILQISNGDDEEVYTVDLYNMSGQQILQQRRKGNGSFKLDITQQPDGTYILILHSSDGKTHYKIIKT